MGEPSASSAPSAQARFIPHVRSRCSIARSWYGQLRRTTAPVDASTWVRSPASRRTSRRPVFSRRRPVARRLLAPRCTSGPAALPGHAGCSRGSRRRHASIERRGHDVRGEVVMARREARPRAPDRIVDRASPDDRRPARCGRRSRRYSVARSPAATSRSRWKAASSRLMPSAPAASSRPTGSLLATTSSYSCRRFGSSRKATASTGSSTKGRFCHGLTLTARSVIKRA